MGTQKQAKERNPDDLLRHLKEGHYPKASGIYLMKDRTGTILYVGKAKNLQNRVRQYFTTTGDGRLMIPHLMEQVASIDTLIVTSEKEALLLENNLIKKHQPKYNALLKDDKNFFSLMINHSHPWPMIRLVRYKGHPPKNQLYFGPYTNASAAKEMLQLMRKLFPMRTCSDRELISRKRPCILYDIKRCIAPCVGKCTKEEYELLSEQAIQFLRGHSNKVLTMLKEQRAQYMEQLAFEKAEKVHRSIVAIEKTLEQQQVEQFMSGDYDVYGLHHNAQIVVLMQLIIREGKLIGSKEHLFIDTVQTDQELISSFLVQTYYEKEHEKSILLLPCALEDRYSLSELLQKEILFPKQGKRQKLVEMARVNAEAVAQRIIKENDATHDILMGIEEKLGLINYPMRIECFDNSNLSQTGSVSAKVSFKKGRADTAGYRKYKLQATDDYGALEEVLTRRFKDTKKEEELPDLILIDGGKGQLHIAQKVLASLDIARVDLVAISKEEGRHDKGLAAEKLFIAGQKEALLLSPRSNVLLFLQRVRDEAHRFAITFQRKRRQKELLTSSLEKIPGIGPIKTKRLLIHFGSLAQIAKATREEWLSVPGITQRDCDCLRKYLT
jgi:excinuclease ABC subunit C